MRHLSSLLSLLVVSLFAGVAHAGNSCVAFDVNWDLLAFGFNGKDYNAGTHDTWTTGNAQDITTGGRPPFNGASSTCFLSQYTNAIYVLGADTANPSSIYIFDATAKSWSRQAVNVAGFNPASFNAILDHDTNVFYALSQGQLFSLDMGLLKTANSTPLSWMSVQNPGFPSSYQPVMALAKNHIHFLDVPGIAPGSAVIFVIHFNSVSYLQPQPQHYGDFPATHGQATSFFQNTGVQLEFAFIPDDGSATYVINVGTNTTRTLPGPTIKDSLATYFASTDALVQLSSSGQVSYLLYNSSSSGNAAPAWSKVGVLPIAVPTLSKANASGSNSGSLTGSAKGTASAKSTGSSNSALSKSRVAGWGVGGAALLVLLLL